MVSHASWRTCASRWTTTPPSVRYLRPAVALKRLAEQRLGFGRLGRCQFVGSLVDAVERLGIVGLGGRGGERPRRRRGGSRLGGSRVLPDWCRATRLRLRPGGRRRTALERSHIGPQRLPCLLLVPGEAGPVLGHREHPPGRCPLS